MVPQWRILVLGVLTTSFALAQTKIPLTPQIAFEENHGQAESQIVYQSHGSRSTVALTRNGVMLEYRDAAPTENQLECLEMRFEGANPNVVLRADGILEGKVNYLIGSNPAKWQTNVPTFAQVRYRDLYPGVDAVFYGKEGNLEYDFVVSPGASPDNVRLRFAPQNLVRVDRDGSLVIKVGGRELREPRPMVYQMVNGRRRTLPGEFVLHSDRTVGFEVAAYDHSRELVIDPTLVYSTLIGTSYINQVSGIAVDASGNVYATGFTYFSFPTKNAFEGNQPSEDAFVTKFSASGGSLIYSTYLGGNGSIDQGTAIGVDRFGDAYIAGLTNSTNFPVSAHAIQSTFHGGRADAFATKLNASGSGLVYSTYLGGSGDDGARGLAIDSEQRLYIAGFTCSPDFPVANAFQPTSGTGLCAKPSPGPNAFVARISATGTAFDYSTYLGGTTGDSASGIAVDSTFSAYVTGGASSPDFPVTSGAFQAVLPSSNSPFVTKFAPDGRSLVFSTFVGGNTSDSSNAIAVDSTGHAYITGIANSTNFPVTSGAFQKTSRGTGDAFVTKLFKTGGGLIYSTYLGGSGIDLGNSIAVDGSGEAHVAGFTTSTNFPVRSALQSTFHGGSSDAFVAKLSSTGGSLVYSTYFGGSGADTATCIRLDGSGNVYVGGVTNSANFHTTSAAFQRTLKGSDDGFVTKIKP